MPFKSKKQQRFMFAAEGRGEIPKGTARRWAHHTKDIKSLPETAHKKKGEDMTSAAYRLGMATRMNKIAKAPKLLGMEGLDSGQVADFNRTGNLPSAPAPISDMPSVADRPPRSAARDAATDASMGTVQNPVVKGTSGMATPVDTSRPYDPAIHGKDYMAPYKMPEGYTPPAGSSVGRAWEGIAQNRKLLGELPGGAEYDRNAREHAYEGEQVYQNLRASNEKRYQEMADKGWISPTKNEGVYKDWQQGQRNQRGRVEMEGRAERARKEIGEKGLQGQWDAYQSRGGWKQEYPKGENFNIDVNDPRTQTPEMRRNIARGKIDKTRAQAAGNLLGKVQSGNFKASPYVSQSGAPYSSTSHLPPLRKGGQAGSMPKEGEDMTSTAYQFGMAMGMKKQAGPMAWLGRKAIMPAVKGVAKPLEWLLGKLPGETMAGAAGSVGSYRAGLDKAMREPSARLFKGRGKAKKLEELVGRQSAYGGAGAAAVGIPALASVLAAVSHGRRRKAEEALKAELAASEAAKEAQLGTPFMDGFLIQCAKAGLNEKQTADVLEKAAQDEGVVGKECKAFLERLAACDE